MPNHVHYMIGVGEALALKRHQMRLSSKWDTKAWRVKEDSKGTKYLRNYKTEQENVLTDNTNKVYSKGGEGEGGGWGEDRHTLIQTDRLDHEKKIHASTLNWPK